MLAHRQKEILSDETAASHWRRLPSYQKIEKGELAADLQLRRRKNLGCLSATLGRRAQQEPRALACVVLGTSSEEEHNLSYFLQEVNKERVAVKITLASSASGS